MRQFLFDVTEKGNGQSLATQIILSIRALHKSLKWKFLLNIQIRSSRIVITGQDTFENL